MLIFCSSGLRLWLLMGYCGRLWLNGLEVKRINSRKLKVIIFIIVSIWVMVLSGIWWLKMVMVKV